MCMFVCLSVRVCVCERDKMIDWVANISFVWKFYSIFALQIPFTVSFHTSLLPSILFDCLIYLLALQSACTEWQSVSRPCKTVHLRWIHWTTQCRQPGGSHQTITDAGKNHLQFPYRVSTDAVPSSQTGSIVGDKSRWIFKERLKGFF